MKSEAIAINGWLHQQKNFAGSLVMVVVYHYQMLQISVIQLFPGFFLIQFMDLKNLLEVHSFKNETSYCIMNAIVNLL